MPLQWSKGSSWFIAWIIILPAFMQVSNKQKAHGHLLWYYWCCSTIQFDHMDMLEWILFFIFWSDPVSSITIPRVDIAAFICLQSLVGFSVWPVTSGFTKHLRLTCPTSQWTVKGGPQFCHQPFFLGSDHKIKKSRFYSAGCGLSPRERYTKFRNFCNNFSDAVYGDCSLIHLLCNKI